MATTPHDPRGGATDQQLPPAVRGLIAASTDLLQAGARLLNAHADRAQGVPSRPKD